MFRPRKFLSLLLRGSHIEYGPWLGTEERQSRAAMIAVWRFHPCQLWLNFAYKGTKITEEDFIYGSDQSQD